MKNLTIALSLRILLLVFALALLIISVFAIRNLKVVDRYILSMYNDRVVCLKQLKNISDAFAVNIVDCAHKTRNGNISWNEAISMLESADNTITENWNAYLNTFLTNREKEITVQVTDLMKISDEASFNLMQILKNGKSQENELKLDILVRNELYQKIDPLTGKISELINVQLEESQKLKDESEQIYKQTRILTVIIGLLGLSLSILIGISISNRINKSILLANNFINDIASGNLKSTINYERHDEIGKLMGNVKLMQVTLLKIVQDISSGADALMNASEEVSKSSQLLSQGASEQASSVEEISSSMEEISSTIQQSADNSQNANLLASHTGKNMDNVSDVSSKSNQSIKRISEKIAIINEIAFQTNILALNAAVEAARAGNLGKGFAVVAYEVRKLAERSKIAADEIVTLANQSVSVTDNAVALISEMLPNIQKISNMVQEITSSSIEQNSGANQVNTALQQLNFVTQSNAATAEEMAGKAEELESQAEDLKKIISVFTI
jgi:methyl-accepting chemotaxis protein